MRHALYDPKISTKVYLFTVQTARERTTNDSLYTKTKTLEINYLKIGNSSPRIFSGVVCVVCGLCVYSHCKFFKEGLGRILWIGREELAEVGTLRNLALETLYIISNY